MSADWLLLVGLVVVILKVVALQKSGPCAEYYESMSELLQLAAKVW